jgi:hypothetical protein
MGAREQLEQLHWQRGQAVQDHLAPGERVLDTGSARSEEVPGRRATFGNEDFEGFLVATDQQLIYSDAFGVIRMPWHTIESMSKERFRGLMTSGLRITFNGGETWLFSGNTPFVKALLRLWKRS